MGNRKSTQNLVKQDILVKQDYVIAKEDEFHIRDAADVWWSNMLAVVELRQKGSTMVSRLPGGVFRHMLEY